MFSLNIFFLLVIEIPVNKTIPLFLLKIRFMFQHMLTSGLIVSTVIEQSTAW